ncbi:MAG: HEAT repeat protein, partial [Myxococcota bacterium]
ADGLALDDLLYATRDGRPVVRSNALGLLARSKTAKAVYDDVVARISPLVRDPDALVRVDACAALGVLGGSTAVRPLVRALGDADASVAQAATDAVFGLGVDPGASLLQHLGDHPKAAEAATALLVRFGVAVVPSLADALVEARSAVARSTAAAALGGIGKPAEDGIASLLKALTDPIEPVRIAAAAALGFVGIEDDTILSALQGASRDPVPKVRRAAAVAAARIAGKVLGDRGAAEATPIPIPGFEDGPLTIAAIAKARKALDEDIEVRSLSGALRDGRSIVRANAALAVGTFGETGADVAEALAMLLRDGDVTVRRAAMAGFTAIGPAASAANFWLLGALSDGDPVVSEGAVQILSKGHPDNAEFLTEGLRSDSDVAQNSIFRVYGALKSNGVPTLIAALKHSSALVRLNAAKALETLAHEGADSASDALEDALSDPIADVRAAASRALDAIRGGLVVPPNVIEADPVLIDGFETGLLDEKTLTAGLAATSVGQLIRALSDGRPIVRRNAAAALGLFADKTAIGPLSVALKDSGIEVQKSAAMALGQIGQAEASAGVVDAVASILTVSLGDRSAAVAGVVSAALDAIGDKAIDALVGYLSQPIDLVARTVLPLLAKRGEAGRDALGKALGDPSPRVRAAAARGLLVVGRTLATSARDAVETATDDNDDAVRREARQTLAHIDGRDIRTPDKDVAAMPMAGFDKTLLSADVLAKQIGEDAPAFTADALLGLLLDGRKAVRANAALALGGQPKLIEKGVRDRLLLVLKDGAAEVRERTVISLGAAKPDSATAIELVVMLEDASPAVVQATEAALAAFGDAAVDAYIYALDNLPQLVRRSVLPMLASLGKKAVDPLLHALTHDASHVRLNALSGLMLLGTKIAQPARQAVVIAREDSERDVRLQALAVLDMLDGVVPKPIVLEPTPMPIEGFDTGPISIDALTKAKKTLAKTPLDALLRDGRARVRENAARALGVVGSASPLLTYSLKDGAVEVRRAAIETLTTLGKDALTQARPLVGALTDRDTTVREGAIAILEGLGKDAVPALIEGFRVSQDVANATVLPLLLSIGKPAVPAVVAALDEASPFVRLNALKTLIGFHNAGIEGAAKARTTIEALRFQPFVAIDRAARRLLDRLDGKGPKPQSMPVVAMPVPGFDTESLDAKVLAKAAKDLDRTWLLLGLADGRIRVRENAARALAELGKPDDETVEVLARALRDSESIVRVTAAKALETLAAHKVADAVAIPALMWTQRGPDEALRETALIALSKIGAKRVVPVLSDHLSGREDWTLTAYRPVVHTMPGPFSKALIAVASDLERNLTERENALVVLRDLGTKARGTETSLLELFSDQHGAVAVKAVEALRLIAKPSPEIIETLTKWLPSEPRPSMHYAIRSAMKLLSRQKGG